jgi:hypothetical protein
MRRAVAPLILLLLAVFLAPPHAQAVMSAFLPDFLPLGANEPAALVLTGVVLLGLARLGSRHLP